MLTNAQRTPDLVTFTEYTLNGNLNEIRQRLKRTDANTAANQIFERLRNRYFLSIIPLLTINRSQKSDALYLTQRYHYTIVIQNQGFALLHAYCSVLII